MKILVALVILIAVVLLLGVARTWQMEHAKSQVVFEAGAAPSPAPDGFYAGRVPGHSVSWLGKKFNAAAATGINVFANGSMQTEQYSFATSYQNGARDTALKVLAIDYNLPENPFWLHPILDEVVMTSPGHLLGKLHVRILPGYPFTLGYFELTQP